MSEGSPWWRSSHLSREKQTFVTKKKRDKHKYYKQKRQTKD
jgi:hypothetical protein